MSILPVFSQLIFNQGLQFAGGPPFLLPAVAQGPRLFGAAPALRPAPRWPALQALPRPNGAAFGLSMLGTAPFRAPGRQVPIRQHARPITGTYTLMTIPKNVLFSGP